MAEFNPDDLNLDNNPQEEEPEPIPFDDSDDEETEISHAPLDLGGNSSGGSPAPAAKAPSAPRQSGPVESSPDRITGVKTFFTKLHGGAIDFLNEQIADWLKENPNVFIKRTNVVVGEVAAKKTEPNLIITVWY